MLCRIVLRGCAVSLLIGCSAGSPSYQADRPPPPSTHAESLPAGENNLQPNLTGLQKIDTYPVLPETGLWATVEPSALSPYAFGKLPREAAGYVRRTGIKTYVLNAPLPDAVSELPVYLGGAYPEGYEKLFEDRTGILRLGCSFVPAYSLVHCIPHEKGNGNAPINSAEDAVQKATEVLGHLLLPDHRLMSVTPATDPEGGWRVVFVQTTDGRPVYTDKPLEVSFDSEGYVTYLAGRRRPFVGVSHYPARSPEEAWDLLKQGHGFGMHGVPSPAANADQFIVERIEVAYVVPHVTHAREVVQPYYLFWSSEAEALLIPAIADPYVTWVQR